MIIVTGGAGFIGSTLVKHIGDKTSGDVLVVDKLNKPDKWRNIVKAKFFDIIDRDIFIDGLAKMDSKDVEAVIHMGACTDTTEFNMDYLITNNYEYSKKLCSWCLDKGVRFIYASSASVYGDGSKGFSDDDKLTHSLQPLNPYGYSKLLFDRWLINNGYQNRVLGLRFFNVFGPNEYHKGDMSSVIYKAFPMAFSEGVVKLFKSYRSDFENGGQKRDFIYIKDVLNCFDFILDKKDMSGIFNIGTAKARSYNDLASIMLRALDKEPIIEYFDMPAEVQDKYQYFTESDNSKLIAAGYKKGFMELEDSLSDYVNNYLTTSDTYY